MTYGDYLQAKVRAQNEGSIDTVYLNEETAAQLRADELFEDGEPAGDRSETDPEMYGMAGDFGVWVVADGSGDVIVTDELHGFPF